MYKIFKLNSGEVVFGLVVETLSQDESVLTIENPIQLVQTSQEQVGIMPFMPYTENKQLSFNVKNMVMLPEEPTESLIAEHKRIFNIIQVPDSKIIVG